MIEVGREVGLDVRVVKGNGVSPVVWGVQQEVGVEVFRWAWEAPGDALPVKAAHIIVTDLVCPF